MGDLTLHRTLSARFRVRGELASEVGTAYEVTDSETERDGILELLSASIAPDAVARSRLKSQLRRLSTATSERLLRPIATGEAGDSVWVFRTKTPGTSLEERLAAGPLSPAESERLALAIADALADLHRLGLAHRTLCPRVIHVTGESVVLSEAGLDRILRGQGGGAVSGVPGFIAPEHIEGKPWTARGDLYSLGCVWIAMLTGEGPFEGETVEEALSGATKADLEIPSVVGGPAAAALRKLVQRDPRQRPASVREVYRLLGKQAPAEPPVGAITTVAGVPAAAGAKRSTSVPPPVPPGARSPMPWKPSARPNPKPVRPGSLPPPPARKSGRASSMPPPFPGAAKKSWSAPPAPQKRPDTTEELDLELASLVDRSSAAAGLPSNRSVVVDPAENTFVESAPRPIAFAALPDDASATIVTAAPEMPFTFPFLDPTAGEEPPAEEATAVAPEPEPERLSSPPRPSRPPIGSPRDLAALRAARRGKATPSTPPPAPPESDGADAEGEPFVPKPPALEVPDFLKDAPGAHGEPIPAHRLPTKAESKATRRPTISPELQKRALQGAAAAAALLVVYLVGGAIFGGDGESAVEATAPAEQAPVATAPTEAAPSSAIAAAAAAPAADDERDEAEPAPGSDSAATEDSVPAPDSAAAEPAPAPAAESASAAAPAADSASASASPRAAPSRQASASGSVDAVVAEARVHYRARRYARAEAAYLRATRMAPSNAGLFGGLGAARLAQGKNRAAIEAYRRATQLAPTNSGFFSALGRAYRGAGNKAAARNAYRRAVQLNPSNASARRELQSLGG